MTAVTPQGSPHVPPERPRWPIVVAVGIAGAVLGYLLGAVGGTSDRGAGVETAPVGAGDAEGPSSPPPDGPGGVPLGGLVPGLEGTLVAQVGRPAPYMGLMVWSRGWSAPRQRSIGVGGPISPNASGGQIARLGRAAADVGPDSALYVGSWLGSAMAPARLGVRSFAWHADDSNLIAWFEAVDEPSGADLPPGFESFRRFYEPRELRFSAVGTPFLFRAGDPVIRLPGAELLAWGTWGYAVVVPEVEIDPPGVRLWLVVLGPDGRERWRALDHPAAVSPTGLLLLDVSRPTGEFRIVTAENGVEVGTVRMEHGVTTAAAFSPDGGRLAFLGRTHDPDGWVIAVWDLEAAAWAHVADLPGTGYNAAGPPDLRWTPDGRFLHVPGRLHTVAGSFGISFYDTIEDTAYHVDLGPMVRVAFVRQSVPVSDPEGRAPSDDGWFGSTEP